MAEDNTPATEQTKDVTPVQSEKGATPAADKPAELDALKATLAETQKALAKMQKEAKAKEDRELEEQGKHKELIEKQKAQLETLAREKELAERKVGRTTAVLAAETEHNRSAIMEIVEMLDRETGHEKDYAELITMAEAKLDAWGAKGATSAFGSTGSPRGGLAGQTAKVEKLVELGKLAMKTGSRQDQANYTKFKQQLAEENVPIPSNLAKLIQQGK